MQTDVLVVGAGPAGSATAAALAQAGFGVVLADQKTFPRDKPCGEFLSPECLPYLEALGAADAVQALGPQLVRGMHLHCGERRALGRFLQIGERPVYTRTGFGIRRQTFDQALVAHAVAAGVQFLPGHACRGPQRAADGRVVGAELVADDGHPVLVTARWVVAADGLRSPLARALSLSEPVRWLERLALVGHFRSVEASPYAEVHLLPRGFFAATAVDQELFSVNLVLERSEWRGRTAADWDAFVQDHARRHAPHFAARLAPGQRLAPWRGCGPFAHRTKSAVVPGMALVGDAAGYVDPLTGEGIYFALCGAQHLSTALAAALHEPGRATAAMDGYLAARRRELVPRLQASAWLQRLLRWPALVHGFVAAAARWPAVADLVVTLTGDTIHPRDLRRPSFWRAFRAALA
ncbi:MAG: NAD(P)/FAD-dependent oxidoreductase [Planctomycetes bacterium]|nr:NAD(P)/FAD-dependent oxidoreductase [Planctomycetota bacterium]